MAIPFRCDAPGCRRFMELAIEPREDHALALTATLVREEPREDVALLDPATPRSSDFLTVCSWCKGVRLPNGAWVEVEIAVRQLRLLTAAVPRVTHGICGPCESLVTWQMSGCAPTD